jgi:hypothetical protein
MKTTPRKRKHTLVLRTTISITPVLMDAFQGIAVRGGYTGLSDYVQASIRRDAKVGVEGR